MKRIHKEVFKIMFAYFMLFVTIVITSFAWTSNTYANNQDIIGKSGNSYFHSGTGTSIDPFIINSASHMYNLSYLQNIGFFNGNQFYFKIADIDGISPTTIDFSQALNLYQSFEPIGTLEYPFSGVFDGNNSTLANYTINGNNYQDVGTFGYVDTTANIYNLFLESPTILSNPPITNDTTNYHGHNNDEVNIATGYIVGHLEIDANIHDVYVISPTIDSSLNQLANRSQYGLIGYNEADSGLIAGGPEDVAYSFNLDADDAYAELVYALQTYGNYYVNGSGITMLSDIMASSGATSNLFELDTGYSLSTIQISQIPYDSNPVYLYDQLVADGHEIGSELTGYYSKENIDLVGSTIFALDPSSNVLNFNVEANAKNITTPYAGYTFTPTDYEKTIIIYVKPASDLNNLGEMTASYVGGGGPALYKGTPGLAPSNVSLYGSGIPYTLGVNDSFCAIDLDEVTGVMTVVDPTIDIPDFYVFLIGVANGQSKITDIYFNYTPADLNTESLTSVANIDFIYDQTDITNLPDGVEHTYSYVNFGYDLTASNYATQHIKINTEVQIDGTYQITFDSYVSNDEINLNIVNIYGKSITIINGFDNPSIIYSGTDTIIRVVITSSGITVLGGST